ncbi:MFS transporter [Streptosporangium sp. H16]|uniref:MFS transporter n=1 Tax=Streptosporangium sp. H16 TaxID=3444184 RepID=UPI003F7A5317
MELSGETASRSAKSLTCFATSLRRACRFRHRDSSWRSITAAPFCVAGAGGEVVYGPAAMTTLLTATPNETRGRVTSLWSATATFSLGVSSAVTGMLIDRLGVSVVFVVLGLVMAVAGGSWMVAGIRIRRSPPTRGEAKNPQNRI